jgi:hypothetical protein
MKKFTVLFGCLVFAVTVLVIGGFSKPGELAKAAAQEVKPSETKPAEPEKKAEEVKATVYWMVTDPTTKKVYYTEEVKTTQGGAAKFKDAKTGSEVTLQNSEVKEISKDEFKAALAKQEEVKATEAKAAEPEKKVEEAKPEETKSVEPEKKVEEAKPEEAKAAETAPEKK